MVARCSAAGVDIYADAVINHMAGVPEGVAADTRNAVFNDNQLIDQFVDHNFPLLAGH